MIKNYVKIALGAACLTTGAAAWGVPAKPTPITVTQPDGTEITVTLRGDERGHFYLSEEGQLLLDRDGALYYAEITAEGRVEPSTILARPAAMLSAAERQRVPSIDTNRALQLLESQHSANPRNWDRLQSATVRKAQAKAAAAADEETTHSQSYGIGLFPGTGFPCVGDTKGLVILVEYQDVKFYLDDPYDYFSRLLNEEGFSDYNGTGSARDYFIAASDSVFQPQFDLYGPVTLPQNMSYYGANDYWGNDLRPEEMVIDACDLLDDEVDFSQYDTDGDGFLDNVFIFYAGLGEATNGSANSVWPHSWDITLATSTPYYYDGVQLDHYACTNEWDGIKPDGIGTFVHEFSHVMGLPDLYATSYTNAFTPGYWSVLDYGPYNNDGRTPPNYSVYERNSLKWLSPSVLNGTTQRVTLPAITSNQAYIIETESPNEFFLLENRQQEGWDKYIPGHGMLIWHIDYNETVWANNVVNNTATHQYVDIVEADNTRTEPSRSGDSWPGTGNRTSYSSKTTPALRTWDKDTIAIAITEIAEEDGLITFLCTNTTPRPSVEDIALVATDATEVGATSFVANWEAVEGATDYLISIITPSAEATWQEDVLDFADGLTLPEGWTTTAERTYSVSGYCGAEIPALRLEESGGYLESPVYDADIAWIEFWHRGISTHEASALAVMAMVDEEWTEVIESGLTTARGGLTQKTEMPADTRAVRIEYRETERQGGLSIDDVVVAYDLDRPMETVDPYDNYSAGTECSLTVTGLQPNTTYVYTVVAYDGEHYSLASNAIEVTTTDEAGIVSAIAQKARVLTATGAIMAETDGAVEIYSIDGRLAARGQGGQWISVNPGLYIVRAGSTTAKIVVY